VRIPREFELPGEDAIIRKGGQRLIIEPAPPKSLLAGLSDPFFLPHAAAYRRIRITSRLPNRVHLDAE
jgi:virulence-associated protein VagC